MSKKVYVAVLCAVLAVSLAAAAIAQSGRDRFDHELLFGVRGLDNIGLSTFGGELGIRVFLSERIAIRPSFSMMSDDRITPAYYDDYTDGSTSEDRQSYDLILEYYLEPKGRILPYWGIGAAYDDADYEDVRSVPIDPYDGMAIGRKTSDEAWSILLAVGVQWQVIDEIRLGVEHKLQYRDYSRSLQTDYYNELSRSQESDGSSFGSSSSSLYLSVGF